MSTDKEPGPPTLDQVASLLALGAALTPSGYRRAARPASQAKKARTKAWRKSKANAAAKAIAKRRRRNKAARKARKGK